jgi:hypothetical protein
MLIVEARYFTIHFVPAAHFTVTLEYYSLNFTLSDPVNIYKCKQGTSTNVNRVTCFAFMVAVWMKGQAEVVALNSMTQ